MTTYHLHLINDTAQNTAVTVRWKCTSCGQFCDFAREGLGEPHASETFYPDDGDVYLSPNGICVPSPLYVSKDVFFGYFTDTEIVAITNSATDNAIAAKFRFQNIANGIPINHPLVKMLLDGLEADKLLGTGRAAEIIAQCTPV